jgi:hypothetical protein
MDNLKEDEKSRKNAQLRRLTLEQVQQIDSLLSNVGLYGEVILVVENGMLKYINTMESHKVISSTSAVATIKRTT